MRLVLLTATFVAVLPSALLTDVRAPFPVVGQDRAQAGNTSSDKDAFNSAKELGTIEAWEAFLNAYPNGFYADLARAYVKKLGSEPAFSAPKSVKPKTVKKTSARLATITAEPGVTPWRIRRYEMDEGNASAMAASVASDGVELLFHCDGRDRLAGILRKSSRGNYPKFDERIQQGLAAKGGDPEGGEAAMIPIRFSDGTVYSVSATVQGLTGEVSLAQDSKGSGFRAAGNLISEMMSGKTVSIDAPPFGATLQLTKSRKALCSVINKCGARVARCGKSKVTRKKRYKKKRIRKKARAPICPAGKSWNGTNCAQNPYLDNQGRPLDGYVIDKYGNINQDNGGGE